MIVELVSSFNLVQLFLVMPFVIAFVMSLIGSVVFLQMSAPTSIAKAAQLVVEMANEALGREILIQKLRASASASPLRRLRHRPQ